MNKKEYNDIENAVRCRGTDVFFDNSLDHIKDPKFIKLLKELHAVYTKMDNFLGQEEKKHRDE